MRSVRRFLLALALLWGVVFLGAAGYMLIEGWSFLDAVYQAIISVFAAGSREINPLSETGRIFTIILIVVGVSSLFFALGSGIEVLLEGHLRNILGGGRIMRQIEDLKSHYILCGYGRVGTEVSKELAREGVPFVVVEDVRSNVDRCLEEGYLCLRGDAVEDEVLFAAGIDRAKGLVAALSSDPKNVLVTLTARTLNPKLFIVARGEEDASLQKLRIAGANRAISPYSLGGRRMAGLLTKPLITDYLDTVMHGEELELRLEEVPIERDSPLAGKSLKEAQIRDLTGTLIVAIHKGDHFETNPPPEAVANEGDVLLAMGTPGQLEKLNQIAQVKSS